MLLGLNLTTKHGLRAFEFLREAKPANCGVLILGDSDPLIRSYAPWADETMLKPVDAAYVATRARSYCDCAP